MFRLYKNNYLDGVKKKKKMQAHHQPGGQEAGLSNSFKFRRSSKN